MSPGRASCRNGPRVGSTCGGCWRDGAPLELPERTAAAADETAAEEEEEEEEEDGDDAATPPAAPCAAACAAACAWYAETICAGVLIIARGCGGGRGRREGGEGR